MISTSWTAGIARKSPLLWWRLEWDYRRHKSMEQGNRTCWAASPSTQLFIPHLPGRLVVDIRERDKSRQEENIIRRDRFYLWEHNRHSSSLLVRSLRPPPAALDSFWSENWSIVLPFFYGHCPIETSLTNRSFCSAGERAFWRICSALIANRQLLSSSEFMVLLFRCL